MRNSALNDDRSVAGRLVPLPSSGTPPVGTVPEGPPLSVVSRVTLVWDVTLLESPTRKGISTLPPAGMVSTDVSRKTTG
jgi:hypothetical protein